MGLDYHITSVSKKLGQSAVVIIVSSICAENPWVGGSNNVVGIISAPIGYLVLNRVVSLVTSFLMITFHLTIKLLDASKFNKNSQNSRVGKCIKEWLTHNFLSYVYYTKYEKNKKSKFINTFHLLPLELLLPLKILLPLPIMFALNCRKVAYHKHAHIFATTIFVNFGLQVHIFLQLRMTNVHICIINHTEFHLTYNI